MFAGMMTIKEVRSGHNFTLLRLINSGLNPGNRVR